MRLDITADSVKVDDDEGRIVLIVETDDGDTVTVNIHNVALEFYADVQRRLRPYALEAEHARMSMPIADPEDGYALDDPKHPTFHERMGEGVDLAAVRRLEEMGR